MVRREEGERKKISAGPGDDGQLWLGVEREFFFKVFLDYVFGSHLCFLSNSGK